MSVLRVTTERRQMAWARAATGTPIVIYALVAEDADGRLALAVVAALTALAFLAFRTWFGRFQAPDEPRAGTIASGLATFLRAVVPDLASSLLVPVATLFLFPGHEWLPGATGVILCGTAAGMLVHATAIERWERRHSAYVVQSGYWATKRAYIAAEGA